MTTANRRKPGIKLRLRKLSLLKPNILALDVANSIGFCLGRVGTSEPLIGSINLRDVGTARPRRLLYLAKALASMFARYAIDQVYYEAPMAIAVAARVGATEETMLLLRGAIGVVECEAARAGIEDIDSFTVQEVRKHLLGAGRLPKGTGKKAVMDMVATLGYKVKDDNEADAVAGWLYCSALVDPRRAHLVTPLFAESINDGSRGA